MPTMGTAHVEVEYEGQQERLPLLVVAGSGPTLLGRNWLRKLTLNWRDIYRMSTDNTLVMSADTLLQRYPELLKSTIGTIHGVKGHFQVDHDAEPRFCKPRNVPYALREKVDQELTRLQDEGIITPVKYADWAAPIVPVLKGKGESANLR